ncbi:MAG: aspartyl protease family protein [Myxococcales bacterium]|nr:aspartyl protease family protein [Myxococcales bacterium]
MRPCPRPPLVAGLSLAAALAACAAPAPTLAPPAPPSAAPGPGATGAASVVPAASASAVPAPPDDAALAAAAFEAGRFEEARRLSEQRLAAHPEDAVAARRVGALALLDNRLDDAERALAQALALDPGSRSAAALLGEVHVRRDAFGQAAPLFRVAGREERALQLESFGAEAPYALEGPDEVSLPFVIADPLPVIEARGAGGQPLTLLIDTGGPELILDPVTAARLGVRTFGAREGTFAGGKKAPVGAGKLDAISFGKLTVRRLPVALLDLAPLAQAFGGRRIDGIVGTVVLYHFLSTLDYPGRRLVLRRLGGAYSTATERTVVDVPFLLAGDHFILARGALGKLTDMLWFVDTGLAGGGFTAPEATLAAAGIALDRSQASEGVGGGGKTEVIPFVVPELSLGAVTERNVAGLFSGPFPLENALGFPVHGLVSHGFLKPYAVTFDFAKMRLRLAR